MTIQTKLDALKNNLNAYVSLYAAGLTVQVDGMRAAIDFQLRTLLEENEKLRAAAQAVVDADAKGHCDTDPALWNAIDELNKALK